MVLHNNNNVKGAIGHFERIGRRRRRKTRRRGRAPAGWVCRCRCRCWLVGWCCGCWCCSGVRRNYCCCYCCCYYCYWYCCWGRCRARARRAVSPPGSRRGTVRTACLDTLKQSRHRLHGLHQSACDIEAPRRTHTFSLSLSRARALSLSRYPPRLPTRSRPWVSLSHTHALSLTHSQYVEGRHRSSCQVNFQEYRYGAASQPARRRRPRRPLCTARRWWGWRWSQAQHSHKVTAQSQHSHSTVTAVKSVTAQSQAPGHRAQVVGRDARNGAEDRMSQC